MAYLRALQSSHADLVRIVRLVSTFFATSGCRCLRHRRTRSLAQDCVVSGVFVELR
jgi:hypothetical protein